MRVHSAAGRMLLAAVASLMLYGGCFAWLLDRPLTFGYLRHEMDARLAYAAMIGTPKLVILAGSNGPFSHRCTVIAPILRLPCVNGGVAVGIGLDYVFLRWRPLLHRGDVVYLPMEEAQYVRTRGATMLGPDAAIMLRHDRATLAALPPERWIGALFSTDLRGAILALIETALVAGGFHDTRAEAIGETDAQGDHVGHTAELGLPSVAVLLLATPWHPSMAQIRDGYGARLIVAFIAWANAHGVRVIGGLPTGFVDSPIGDAAVTAIRATYLTHGAAFLELPNRSRYPRADFFDTADHLNETAQATHSLAVAHGLAAMLRDVPPLRDAPPTRAAPMLRSAVTAPGFAPSR